MAGEARRETEWVDGFLFVGNHLALDFLNTKPILEGEPTELLPNAAALERWLIASGIVTSQQDRALVRGWRNSRGAEALVKKLIAFRERLRAAVLRLEGGSLPGDAFLAEVNTLLKEHPQRAHLSKQRSEVVLKFFIEPRRPEDIWAAIAAAVTKLLSDIEPSRIRKCEAESCVVHFYDTSRKGSRRWCSMNICGNRLKVAAYQRRRRNRAGSSIVDE
jgi:predicted RNA-binding Zn ribbon-like protein